MSIVILATPTVPAAVLQAVQQTLTAIFHLPCYRDHAMSINPQLAFNPKRQQYVSSHLLTQLRAIARQYKDTTVVLGIVDVDLYAPKRTFLYGEAEYPGRVALVSGHRLRSTADEQPPETALVTHRLVKEAIHEVGHCLGLPHCPHATCVMHFAATLQDVDQKHALFCPPCHHRYTRLHPSHASSQVLYSPK